ncbi:MAG: LacI family DNA-binding transcriptional regulator [Chloroflexi bacterium]|nr:LacI family DNA-binding transcriptional regulator [Chloroflexota bacterium]
MAAKKQVTIKQVALEAGVSPQTVSRVFNNHPDIARETRRRVQEVITRLGYRPNIIARSLVKQQSYTLGVVIVDGIIWAVPEIGANLTWLQDRMPHFDVPLIFTGMDPHSNVPFVSIDNRSGGRLATEHLLAQGYRHIGLITGPMTWGVARQRQLGWQDALGAAGLTWTDRHMVEGDWSAASGESGLHQLLTQYPALEAVFACNDQMALGVLRAAQQLGRRVPQDLAVVGFDNIPEAAYFWSPLTTVRNPLRELGALAVQELQRMIEARQQEEEVSLPPTAILLQPELFVRESSGTR